mgnify:FL=1
MPKKSKAKNVKPMTTICFCDSKLQFDIPKGVKDSKRVTEKEVFGKPKVLNKPNKQKKKTKKRKN